MGQKKEIGEIFASKLKHGEKSPSTELWNKLNDSLDKQKKMKYKKALYLFLAGAGVLIIIFLLLEINVLTDNPHTLKENRPSEDETSLIGDQHVEHKQEEIKIKDSIANGTNHKQSPQTTFPSEKEIKNNSLHENDNSKYKKVENIQTNTLDDGYEVKKNYYYYNSDKGENMITENIEVIDSLLNRTQLSTDSIPKT